MKLVGETKYKYGYTARVEKLMTLLTTDKPSENFSNTKTFGSSTAHTPDAPTRKMVYFIQYA